MSIKSEVYLRCYYCGKFSCKFCGEVIEMPEQDNFPGAFINDPDLEFYVCDACAKIEVLDKDFESDIPYWFDPDDPDFYVCEAYEECEKIEKDFESDIPFWPDPDDPEFYVRDAYEEEEEIKQKKIEKDWLESDGGTFMTYVLDSLERSFRAIPRMKLQCIYCGEVIEVEVPDQEASFQNENDYISEEPDLDFYVCDACQKAEVETTSNLIDWSDPDPDNLDELDESIWIQDASGETE